MTRHLAAFTALMVCLVGAAPALGAAPTRYSIVNGCYSLVSTSSGRPVGKSPSGGYRLTGTGAEAFRMQATGLGQYLFYGRARDFMAVRSVSVPLAGDQARLGTDASPSQASNWRVDDAGGGAFRIVSLS